MLRLFKVSGDSMAPRFNSGDYILLFSGSKNVKGGDFLVYRHPHYGDLFKQVSRCCSEQFFLHSLNPQGISEAQIGPCDHKRVIGTLLLHFRR